ncbi:hypothetical protein J3E69DRAFT_95773 [Trichoderma sp. SZMC 28015]
MYKDADLSSDILNIYGKAAMKAHRKTNCLTEVMIPSAKPGLKDVSINLSGSWRIFPLVSSILLI